VILWELTMSRSKMMNHVAHLKDEIQFLKSRLKPSATGHIHTTIGVLEERVEEISKELKDEE
tara:strand:+ start:1884 stop:2069 length:186 start_codon:yes stop_codon:yes gene_type:complete